MTSEHAHYRDALGAYAAGALAPAERARVDEHLADCTSCRDELASLAALPGLLGRLTPQEAELGLLRLSEDHATRVAVALARHRRGEQRRLHAWRGLAAAAAIVAIVAALVPLTGGRGGTVFAPVPVAADAEGVAGSAIIDARDWGMAVDLDLRNLPDRNGFILWAIDGDEHRTIAGTWTALEDGSVKLTGACYMLATDVVRLEVSTPDDEVILALEPEVPAS